LQQQDAELLIKNIKLRFPEQERTMYYLYLTTHDSDGALKMNKVISEAGYQENVLRTRLKNIRDTNGGRQLSFFEREVSPIAPRPSTEEIEEHILEIISNCPHSVTKKDLHRLLVDEIYFLEEIDKALKKLKNLDKIRWEGDLNNNAVIRLC
jgi:hypothetical protein